MCGRGACAGCPPEESFLARLGLRAFMYDPHFTFQGSKVVVSELLSLFPHLAPPPPTLLSEGCIWGKTLFKLGTHQNSTHETYTHKQNTSIPYWVFVCSAGSDWLLNFAGATTALYLRHASKRHGKLRVPIAG